MYPFVSVPLATHAFKFPQRAGCSRARIRMGTFESVAPHTAVLLRSLRRSCPSTSLRSGCSLHLCAVLGVFARKPLRKHFSPGEKHVKIPAARSTVVRLLCDSPHPWPPRVSPVRNWYATLSPSSARARHFADGERPARRRSRHPAALPGRQGRCARAGCHFKFRARTGNRHRARRHSHTRLDRPAVHRHQLSSSGSKMSAR